MAVMVIISVVKFYTGRSRGVIRHTCHEAWTLYHIMNIRLDYIILYGSMCGLFTHELEILVETH